MSALQHNMPSGASGSVYHHHHRTPPASPARDHHSRVEASPGAAAERKVNFDNIEKDIHDYNAAVYSQLRPRREEPVATAQAEFVTSPNDRVYFVERKLRESAARIQSQLNKSQTTLISLGIDIPPSRLQNRIKTTYNKHTTTPTRGS